MTMSREQARSLLVEHYGAGVVEAEPTWASVMVDAVLGSGQDDPQTLRSRLSYVDTYLATPSPNPTSESRRRSSPQAEG